MEVIPSHYQVREMAPGIASARRFHGLYSGDVIAVIAPDDKTSLTKRYLEYRVAVQVWLDGALATIEFPHALLSNPLASRADRATWTLRADGKAGQKGQPGTGSKVLVQCINGDPNNAVIVGGYRAPGDVDAPPTAKGDLALAWRYNGVDLEIGADGSVVLTRGGATKADGTPDTDRSPADQVGASVTLGPEGGVRVATRRGDEDEQEVTLDHAAATVTIRAQKGLAIEVADGPATVTASGDGSVTVEGALTLEAGADATLKAPSGKVKLGSNASQKAVLGDRMVALLQKVLKGLQTLTVITPVGTSSPPVNLAVFAAAEVELQTILSHAVEIAETP